MIDKSTVAYGGIALALILGVLVYGLTINKAINTYTTSSIKEIENHRKETLRDLERAYDKGYTFELAGNKIEPSEDELSGLADKYEVKVYQELSKVYLDYPEKSDTDSGSSSGGTTFFPMFLPMG